MKKRILLEGGAGIKEAVENGFFSMCSFSSLTGKCNLQVMNFIELDPRKTQLSN